MSEYSAPRNPELVVPIQGDGEINVVVIERVEPGRTPRYPVVGKSTCWKCGDWCWLGQETYELVKSGQCAGICRQCCAKLLPKGMRPSRPGKERRL